MERTARTRLQTALILSVVFGSGLILGFAADRSLGADQSDVGRIGEDVERERRVPMYEQVGPDEEQRILIDSIVKDYRDAMKALHAEFRASYNPRYEALVRETREAIKGVLTLEQRAAYDSLIAEREKNRAERGARESRDQE